MYWYCFQLKSVFIINGFWNVNDIATYEELINFIHKCAPHAQIIVIDNFWAGDAKSTLKEKAVNNTVADFVSLELIKGNQEYQCGIGTIVYDSESREHIVKHDGVAAHLGDKGMKYIADSVISVIK